MKVYCDITIHGGPNGTYMETFDLPDDLSDEDFTNALDDHLMNYLDGYAEEEGINEIENPIDYSFGFTTEEDGVDWSL
jgi:hypothetical protein